MVKSHMAHFLQIWLHRTERGNTPVNHLMFQFAEVFQLFPLKRANNDALTKQLRKGGTIELSMIKTNKETAN